MFIIIHIIIIAIAVVIIFVLFYCEILNNFRMTFIFFFYERDFSGAGYSFFASEAIFMFWISAFTETNSAQAAKMTKEICTKKAAAVAAAFTIYRFRIMQ